MQSGRRAPELENLPQLPDCAAHVWDWYQQLDRKRTIGMSVNPITWPDIDSWVRVTGINPLRWELDAIAAIDDAYRASLNPESKE